MTGPKNQSYSQVLNTSRLGNKTLFSSAVNKANDLQTKYFSGIDAEIYFGEVYVDEVVEIGFQIQQNTMPLFGYNSYVFDGIAQGARMIQGSFTINFTEANYLYKILDVLGSSITQSKAKVNVANENTLSQKDQNIPVPHSNNTIQERGPLWDSSFDIVCSYGDAKQMKAAYSTMLVLENAVLTGCSQQFAVTGEPIYETYTFIARDIRYEPVNSNYTIPKKQITEEEVFNVLDATYMEFIDESLKIPYGIITIDYRALAQLKSFSFVPKIPLRKDTSLRECLSKNKTYHQNDSISFRVPQSWRDDIVTYCKKNKGVGLMPGLFKVTYTIDGKSTSKQSSIDIRLTEVYSDFKASMLL